MTAPDLTPITAAAVCDDHHWIWTAQPNYPEWLAFISRCSICGRYGDLDLREGWTVVPDSFAAQVREDVARRIEASVADHVEGENEEWSRVCLKCRGTTLGTAYWPCAPVRHAADAASLAREVSP